MLRYIITMNAYTITDKYLRCNAFVIPKSVLLHLAQTDENYGKETRGTLAPRLVMRVLVVVQTKHGSMWNG